MQIHCISQRLGHTQTVDARCDLQHQANAAVYVGQRQDVQTPTVVGLALDEFEAPDVIAMLRP